MGRKIIVVGDPTDHGGRVISGSPTQKINGKAIARLGDQVNCPKKGHGVNDIVEGDASMLINGIPGPGGAQNGMRLQLARHQRGRARLN